jgi:hypothetical protein
VNTQDSSPFEEGENTPPAGKGEKRELGFNSHSPEGYLRECFLMSFLKTKMKGKKINTTNQVKTALPILSL